MLTEKLANDIAVSARIKTAGIFGTAARDLGEEIAPGATSRILKGLGLGLGAGAGAYGIGTALGEGNGLYNDTLNAENANSAAADMAARVQNRRLSNKLINDSQVALPQDITPDSFNSSAAGQFGNYMSGGPARRAERAMNQRASAFNQGASALPGVLENYGRQFDPAAQAAAGYTNQVLDNADAERAMNQRASAFNQGASAFPGVLENYGRQFDPAAQAAAGYTNQVLDNADAEAARIARNRAIGPGMAAAMHATHNPVHAINGPAVMPPTMGTSLAGPDYNSYNDAMRQEAARQAMHDLWRQNQMAAAGGLGQDNSSPNYTRQLNRAIRDKLYAGVTGARDVTNNAINTAGYRAKEVYLPAAAQAVGDTATQIQNAVQDPRTRARLMDYINRGSNRATSDFREGAGEMKDAVLNFINKPRPQVEPRWYPGAPQYGQPIQSQY